MAESSDNLTPNQTELVAAEILKESVESRAGQAKVSFFGTLVAISAFLSILIQNVSWQRLTVWVVPVVVLILWRLLIAFSAMRRIHGNDQRFLERHDRLFRINSILNQTWIGAGVWFIADQGGVVMPYVVTLAISFFGMGAAVSLVNDFRTVIISLPILFGQCIVFWFLKGVEGIHIGLPLLTISILTIAFAWRVYQTINRSTATRFLNDELVKNLAREKSIAETARREAEIARSRAEGARKDAEEARKKAEIAQQEAEDANLSKSKFLAAASHDLKQPLYAASLLRDTLTMHELDDSVSNIVAEQGTALKMLNDMFDNLLEVSRLESGNIDVSPESISVRELLHNLGVEARASCDRKSLVLSVDAPEVYMQTDQEMITRMLRNLLNNAVRYTDSGSVSLSATADGSQVEITIADTGTGIPEEDQRRVFQEFVQLGNPERDRTKGVGLGLSIVKHISDLLGLHINLESTKGKGTAISVRVLQIDPPATETEQTNRSSYKLKISDSYLWIVEDDELPRSALNHLFNKLGVEHDFAVSREDLEQLSLLRGWPDFAILDDMLGDHESGLDIAHWLSKNVTPSHILMVTGNSDPTRLEELDGSPFEVLRKPVDSGFLIDWLNRARDGLN